MTEQRLCACGCGRRATMGATAAGHNTRLRYPKETREQRFWERVAKTDDPHSCWLWTGTQNGHGYGVMQWDGRLQGAHRIAYQLTNGPIAEGDLIRHTCDVPGCVRPSHLLSGSQADNMRDAAERQRVASDLRHHNATVLTYKGETHSIRGWARKYHIPSTMLQDRIGRRGWNIEEALTTPSGLVRHGVQQVSFRGETKTISEWAKTFGLPGYIIYNRLKNGWETEHAMTEPVTAYRPGPRYVTCLTFQGETKKVSTWAKSSGITPRALRNRLKRGWTLERALTAPKTEGH